MTTGSPAASLLATCGSDPIDLTPPLAGRHGTRLKMSLAVFATSLAFSIALDVRLFFGAGAVGSADPRLPAAGAAALPDVAILPISDGAPRPPFAPPRTNTPPSPPPPPPTPPPAH